MGHLVLLNGTCDECNHHKLRFSALKYLTLSADPPCRPPRLQTLVGPPGLAGYKDTQVSYLPHPPPHTGMRSPVLSIADHDADDIRLSIERLIHCD